MASIAAPVTEAQLQEAVEQLCDWLRVWRWHDQDARRNRAGWPDLTLIGPRRADGTRQVLYRELKTARGKLRVAQADVGQMLLEAGHDWGVWRPEDWRSGRIRAELEAIR